jgi:hypothetical protein
MWPVISRQIVDFDEWEEIVQMFIQAAVTVQKAGYDGVQLHSAHGYLLAEYLSPLVCHRILKTLELMSDQSWRPPPTGCPSRYTAAPASTVEDLGGHQGQSWR